MERVGWVNLSRVQRNLLDAIGNLGMEAGLKARQMVIHTKVREHCSVEFSDPETGLRALGVTIEMDSTQFKGSIMYPLERLLDDLTPEDEYGCTSPERRINLTRLDDGEGISRIEQRIRAEIDRCIEMERQERVGLSL